MKKNGAKLTVLDPRGQPSGIYGRRLNVDSPMHAIHDPTFQPRDTAEALSALKMAPRLDTLDGKAIYLVDTGFAGAPEFIAEVDGWFKRNKPAVKTVVVHKKTSMFTDDPELWVELKKKADGVVFGVGG